MSTKRGMGCWAGGILGALVCLGLIALIGVLMLRSSMGPKLARTANRVSEKLGGESLFADRVIIDERTLEVEVPIDGRTDKEDVVTSDVRTLSNRLRYEVDLQPIEEGSALDNRTEDRAYRVEMNVIVERPLAQTSADTIIPPTSTVMKALPGLAAALPTATVSPLFGQLYDNKEGAIRKNLFDFHKLLSRHNYYDCNTILQLKNPTTGQKALWFQADMDVVSDGSDGDRLTDIDDEVFSSSNYQPTTSYGWPKTSKNVNPFLPRLEKALKEAEIEFAKPGLSIEVNRRLRGIIERTKPLVADLKSRSYLIARYDPFIVLPVFMVTAPAGDFTPRIGDYAVVYHDKKLYPAIVGDAGPNYKIGEASLRFGMEIDEKTNPYRRPVSDLDVSYIVFPGSADRPFRAPDFKVWQEKVQGLVDAFGGVGAGYSILEWTNEIPASRPPAAPVPEPSGNDTP